MLELQILFRSSQEGENTNNIPSFFSNGVINWGKTSSDNAKCLPNGPLSGTRFGLTSNGSKYNHCDLTEKLLRIESSERNGSTYSTSKKYVDIQ